MFSNYEGGVGFGASVRKTTVDGAVGVSGLPTRVFSVHFVSTAGGATTLVVRNGTTAAGDIRIQQVGIVSDGVTTTYGENGLLFPDGCFYDAGANIDFAVINFIQ